MGEEPVKNPTGGAVTYVDNTRFGWVDPGHIFQLALFHRLTATQRPGLLQDSRVAIVPAGTRDAGYRWTVDRLNLLGDPEPRVYRGLLPALIFLPSPVDPAAPVIPIRVARPVPLPPDGASSVEGMRVHVRQGRPSLWPGPTPRASCAYPRACSVRANSRSLYHRHRFHPRGGEARVHLANPGRWSDPGL